MRKLIAVTLALLAGTAWGQPAEGEQADYAWFRSLGYPDLGRLPFVWIETGHWWPPTDIFKPKADYGILIGDDGEDFTVFTLGLSTKTYRKTNPKTARLLRVGYERIDVLRSGLGDKYRTRCRGFVLACALAARGKREAATLRWKAASRGVDIRGLVAGEALHHIRSDFTNPGKTFTQHLAAYDWWRKRFGEDNKRLESERLILKRMSATEVARKTIPPKARAAMTPNERIAEDIYQLRYARENFSYDPPKKSPLAIVAAHGLAAVPGLLETTGSEEFTRTLRLPEPGGGPQRRLALHKRVGDLALSALGRVAGRSFSTANEARAWWSEVQSKGELQVLLEGVRGVGLSAPKQARLLARKYPSAAADAILTGLARADSWVRDALIRTLAGVKDERVGPALERAAECGNVAAAWELLKRGSATAVPAMIATWEARSAGHALFGFLCHCGDAGAVNALHKTLRRLSVRVRIDVMSSLLEGRASLVPPAPKDGKPGLGYDKAVERLLAESLADTKAEAELGMWMRIGDLLFQNPRVCDVAACALAKRYPKKYEFDNAAGQTAHDTQRVIMLNRWRKTQGLEPLPVPRRVAGPRAGQVVEVQMDPVSAKPDEALKKKLNALIGKPLTGEAFVGIVLHIASALPDGSKGILLGAKRNDQGAYSISVRLLKKPYKCGWSSNPKWNTTNRLFVDGRTWIGFNQGSLSPGYARKPKAWAEYREKLDKAFATDPRQTLETWIKIGQDR